MLLSSCYFELNDAVLENLMVHCSFLSGRGVLSDRVINSFPRLTNRTSACRAFHAQRCLTFGFIVSILLVMLRVSCRHLFVTMSLRVMVEHVYLC